MNSKVEGSRLRSFYFSLLIFRKWDVTMQDLGEYLGYDEEPCPNCGRVRVEKYSGGKRICEKCAWCIEDEGYYIEEEPEYKGVTLDELWREARDELYESMFCGN